MKSRFIVLASLGLTATAVLGVTMPASRHLIRDQLARHRHVRFGTIAATPIVPVPQAMPAVTAADEDLRFVPLAVAEVPAPRLSSPQLDARAFDPPTTVVGKSVSAAAAVTATIDRSTEASPAPTQNDTAFSTDLAGARQALRHYHDSDLGAGDEFARLTAGSLRTALDWAAIRLDSHDAGADRLQAFALAHPGWPALPWVSRRLEEARAATRVAPLVLAQFGQVAPETLVGKLSLARARLASNDAAGAADLVRAVWRSEDLSPVEEATVLHDFGALLRREDHKFRADRLLYAESVAPALRTAALAGPDVVLLARARAAVIASTGADAAIAAVPKPLQTDPGLTFARIQKARRAGKITEAAALMLSAPHDPTLLVDGDQWWVERRLVARKLLDLGDFKAAYAIAAGHAATSEQSRIEAEFHAGWIALRFLNDPALAAPHFAAASAIAATPISVARGTYWQARTAEAQGDTVAADRFYALAADHPTTFYGQLASAKLGRGPLVLRRPAAAATGSAQREAVPVVAQLFALGERDLAVSLALAMAKTDPDEAQVAALAKAVEATQDARATLIVGKAAAQRGMPVDDAAFPTFGVPGYRPLDNSADRPTVFAIARQESEFDPHAVSSAGAKGLMQVIDSTARQTAERAGLDFNGGRLLSDAAFNAQIGAAHLGKLLNDQDGSYILTFAAYNAGARKVQEWIAAYGDPRRPGVDPVDWIERIPFTETRNYVQRVFENLQIYRARFGMPTALLTDPQPPVAGKGT